MFKLEYSGYNYKVFSDKLLLPSGQTAYLEISLDSESNTIYCPIYFVIYHKRKQLSKTIDHIIGKDGILGLLWAKNKVIEFEEWVNQDSLEFDKTKKYILYCQWTDNRRRKAYEYGLTKLGFSYMRIFGHRSLGKIIYEP